MGEARYRYTSAVRLRHALDEKLERVPIYAQPKVHWSLDGTGAMGWPHFIVDMNVRSLAPELEALPPVGVPSKRL